MVMLWGTTALASNSICLQGKIDKQTISYNTMVSAMKESAQGAKGGPGTGRRRWEVRWRSGVWPG